MSYPPPYTTVDDVKSIIDWNPDLAPDLQPFIDSAHVLVVTVCNDPLYISQQLEMIERWLAAHLYHVLDMKLEMQKIGASTDKYAIKVELGFDGSHYGQMAMRMDISGGLARLNQAAKTGQLRSRIGIMHISDTCVRNPNCPSSFLPFWWFWDS